MKKVICGFPGVGKSTVFGRKEEYRVNILDSDSSTFDKSQFPANYIAHIKEHTQGDNIILASSHDTVRAALVAEGIPFHLVFPAEDCKMEYLARYAERGSPAAFVDMMYNKWSEFIQGCMAQQGCSQTILQRGQFLNDVPELILLRR